MANSKPFALVDEKHTIIGMFSSRNEANTAPGFPPCTLVILTRSHAIGDAVTYDRESGYESADRNEIQRLMIEAGEHGDAGCVRECQLALGLRTDGNPKRARQLCSKWIADAAAESAGE